MVHLSHVQIEEKFWVHRRGSFGSEATKPISIIGPSPPLDARSEAASSLGGSFGLHSIHENVQQSVHSPVSDHTAFLEEREEKEEVVEANVHGGHIFSSGFRANTDALDPVEAAITAELEPIFHSLRKCLDLRDKYMVKSRQRLGDNPKDHDGHFQGLDDEIADVSGVRPDSNFRSNHPPPSPYKRWQVYPPPPPPHWHWSDKEQVLSADGNSARTDREFVFEDCTIPEPHSWEFDIDDKGVFQVYENVQGTTKVH